MNQYYETIEMELLQALAFRTNFKKKIGTECEIFGTNFKLNRTGAGLFYILCMGLKPLEIIWCQKIEKEVTK